MIIGYIGEAAWMLAKCYVSYRIVKEVSKERFSKQWISVLLWSVVSGLVIAYTVYTLHMTKVVGNNISNTTACSVFIILSVLLYQNRKSFLARTIGICIFFELDDLLDYFTQTILYVFLDTAGEGTPRLFQLIGVPRGILLLCYAATLLVLGGRIARVYRKYIVPTWLSTWKGLLPVGAFWFICRYFQRVYVKSSNLVTDTYFFAWMIACISIFAVIVIVYIIHKMIRKKAEDKVQQIRYEALEQEIQRTKDNNQERQKLIHDIKGNLAVLKNYLEQEDIDSAKAFLQEIFPGDHTKHVYRWSGYQILDMVISLRVEEAEKAGIRCEVMCDQIQELTLQDIEVCSLFENLLTNAIEAQGEGFKGQKWINLEVRQKKNTLYIEITNPFEQDIVWDRGKIQTHKKDMGFHGIGLSIIHRIIEKHDGVIDISTANHVFRVRIMLKAVGLT